MTTHAAEVKAEETRPSRSRLRWLGRVLSALPILMMLLSAAMKFVRPPGVVDLFAGKFGYRDSSLSAIGLLELSCVVLYAVPRTAVLGAILLTAYLGGAVATHVRIGDVFMIPLALGICAWAGLYFRDERIRELLPLRKVARDG